MKQIIDNYFKDLLGGIDINLKPTEEILSIINKAVFETAAEIDGSLNSVNAYNVPYWEQNSNLLSNIFFDIHPNTFGYKKMAMDIYLKLQIQALI
ncbi:hypothetical protein [Mycoplasma nasistruthionis]|uniref:SGNH/GDSL hydrolase family protein n=1 Tax=Mycoplasma nasistruthionis TaxID=353852 RepID=A0A5B7XVE7_9MOLU|nr:hypothetical protein [Mycoplasma nasistruthionis]QCZ36434.1 hypothetical protein FG904_00105 [Mycoplasma nasistruthionis]